MKQLIFGLGISFLMMYSVASANDYYQKECCVPSPDLCCNAGLDGFYVGGNFGMISLTAYRTTLEPQITNGPLGKTFMETDFTLGPQIGYNWNCQRVLFGLVADWNWTNIQNRYLSAGGFSTYGLMMDWYLTIRGRIGINFRHCLFYLTAGSALAHLEMRFTANGAFYSVNHSHWGWTGGIGVEYLLGCKWSLGGDLLYMNFANSRYNNFPNSVKFYRSDTVWVARAIVNYHFGKLLSYFCCKRKGYNF